MANINKRGAIGVCLSFEYSISRKNDYCYTVTSTVEYLLGCSKYVYQLKIHLCFVDYRSIRKMFCTFLCFIIGHLTIDTPILG